MEIRGDLVFLGNKTVKGLRFAVANGEAVPYDQATSLLAALETDLEGQIAAEASIRASADTSLQNQINALTTTDSTILYTPADQDNQAGTFRGLITGTTLTLRSALDRLASRLPNGGLVLSRTLQAGTSSDATLPSTASLNRLENILDTLWFRGTQVPMVPSTANIAVYTNASGVLTYARMPLANLVSANARSVLGNTTNSAGNITAFASSAARQFVASNSGNTAVGFRTIDLDDLPNAPSETVLGNVSGGTAVRVNLPMLNVINSRNAFALTHLGLEQVYSSGIWAATALKQVTGTTESSIFSGSAIGTLTIPALKMVTAPGAFFIIQFRGSIIVPSTPSTLTLKVKLNGTVIAQSLAFPMPNGSIDGHFQGRIGIVLRAVSGTNGTHAHGDFDFTDSTNAHRMHGIEIDNVAGLNIDWTAAQAIDVTAQWGDTGHTLNVEQCEVLKFMQ